MVKLNDEYFGKAYEHFGSKVITNKSPEAEREYYHNLLAHVDKVPNPTPKTYEGYNHFKGLSKEDGLGTFGPKTKSATYNIQSDLGIKKDNIPGRSTIFGLHLTYLNAGEINNEVREATQAFEKAAAISKSAAKEFGQTYIAAYNNGEEHDKAMKLATAKASLPDNVRESLAQLAPKLERKEGPFAGAPYGHIFSMAGESFDPKIKFDVADYKIGFGTHNIMHHGKLKNVGEVFKHGEVITQEKGYDLFKAEYQRKTEIAEKIIPNFDKMTNGERGAMLDLVYNLKDEHLLRKGEFSPAAFKKEYPNLTRVLEKRPEPTGNAKADQEALEKYANEAAKHYVSGAGEHTNRREFGARLLKSGIVEPDHDIVGKEKPGKPNNKSCAIADITRDLKAFYEPHKNPALKQFDQALTDTSTSFKPEVVPMKPNQAAINPANLPSQGKAAESAVRTYA